MNSVDKSVAPLDAALRRRFDVVPLLPDLEAMTNELGVPGVDPTVPPGQVATAADVKHLALALIAHLNRGVGFLIGSEYAFGHWYLAPLARDFDSVGEAAEALTDVWNYRLLPQLEELFGDRAEQLAALLRLDEVPTPEAQPLQLLSPPAALAELGADAFVARPEEPPGADALLAYFLRLLDEDEGATG
jgi:5-methylcytosine-specific restriction protein B